MLIQKLVRKTGRNIDTMTVTHLKSHLTLTTHIFSTETTTSTTTTEATIQTAMQKHHQNKGPKTDASTTNVSHARETQVPDPLTGKASICSISIRGRKNGRNQSMDSLQSRPPCQCWLRMISKLCSAPPPPWIIQCHTRPGNECQSETPAASGTQVLSTTVVTY